ncbi:hypothetical protein ZIOFF_008333 [Zingiber officinale]|uniref:Uncharacterized protein n=1 Tax=Zingiber officinale TaxID=94328 RepID=A0A8J5LX53_ZINOF|nr:hypothetical protein ZIOFF_008333 [Zingiber officinale]
MSSKGFYSARRSSPASIPLHPFLSVASPADDVPKAAGSNRGSRLSLLLRRISSASITEQCCGFLRTVFRRQELQQLQSTIPAEASGISVCQFTVIEDMSIQVNVPALAMEEVASLTVSDAAMHAPEEIFHGKGNIKEEAELTKEERKRRRANQKRRFRRLKVANL